MANVEIDQQGNVTVPKEDVGTFRDHRLPLRDRLALLAAKIRNADGVWLSDHDDAAARLVYEASDRLNGFEMASSHRESLFRAMNDLIISLRQENERLRREHSLQLQDKDAEIDRLQSLILLDK